MHNGLPEVIQKLHIPRLQCLASPIYFFLSVYA